MEVRQSSDTTSIPPKMSFCDSNKADNSISKAYLT